MPVLKKMEEEEKQVKDVVEEEKKEEMDPEKKKKINMLVNAFKAISALKKKKEDAVPDKIVDRVYLGSIGAALSKDKLKALGITHILTCATAITPAFPDDFTYERLPLLDKPT